MADNYNPFSLAGKTILVTGASSGIGRATAIECSKMGASVILTARNEERLNETLSKMEDKEHIIIPADLLKESDIVNLVNQLPKIDGIVNSAGMTYDRPVKYYSSSAIEELFKINSFASINLIQQALKNAKIRNCASLIFISSIASHLYSTIGNGIYSASKAAVEAFSRQCALELAPLKIRANTILPGFIYTPMTESYITDNSTSSCMRIDEVRKRYGKPEDVAKLTVYLLSDASSFVTGANFVIDGGLSIAR